MRGTPVSAIIHWEGRSVGIIDLASRSLGSLGRFRDRNEAGWRCDVDLADGRLVGNCVERGGTRPLVRDPPRAFGGWGNAPRVSQLVRGDARQPPHVRDPTAL